MSLIFGDKQVSFECEIRNNFRNADIAEMIQHPQVWICGRDWARRGARGVERRDERRARGQMYASEPYRCTHHTCCLTKQAAGALADRC